MANVIVIGGGEKDYWARVEDGVIVRVYPVDRNPSKESGIFGANTDVIPVLRERYPEADFIKLPEPRIHGVGWGYDKKTGEFIAPEAAEPEPTLSRAETLALSGREQLKAELLAEILKELEGGKP